MRSRSRAKQNSLAASLCSINQCCSVVEVGGKSHDLGSTEEVAMRFWYDRLSAVTFPGL